MLHKLLPVYSIDFNESMIQNKHCDNKKQTNCSLALIIYTLLSNLLCHKHALFVLFFCNFNKTCNNITIYQEHAN